MFRKCKFWKNIWLQKFKSKKKEFLKIFKYAKLKNIKYIDTAFSYSNSQKIIGKYSLNLKIITKNSELPKSASNPQNWIKKIISKSLSDLKTKKLYAVLFHYPPYKIEKKKYLSKY